MPLPLPENEASRLGALWSYRILDTPPEERFDDLARLAAYVCGTPIGLIGLIDNSREWFKSRVGWEVSEIPREASIGTYAILQPEVLVVSDTLKDKRFARYQMATRAGVRFYAGAPLLTPERYALGTLCVMDHVPRALTEGQGRMLWTLARQVMAHLEDQRGLGSNPGTESHERYRRFFESSVVGFYRTTLDGQVLDCNPAFVRIMGYGSREELLACHALEFYFSSSDRQDFLEQCRSLGSLTNFASRLRRKDGSAVWVLENVKPVLGPDGAPTMIEGTLVDISQQKFAEMARSHAEKALTDSETRYRRLFETAKDGILILDFQTGQIADVNPYLIEMLGYTHADFVGKKLWEIGPFKDIPAARSAFRELQQKGVIRYEDLPLETKDGRRISVEFVSNVYNVDGMRVAQCNIRDITERVRAEAALKMSETQHRSLIDGAGHGICRATLEGRFVEVNPALVAMLGYSAAEEILKLNLAQDVFAEPEEGLRLMHKWQLIGKIDEEVQWRRADQRLITVRLNVRVLGGEQGMAGLEVIAVDVTERRALEEQMRQALKIEAVGQLAGGMAHEFNNYLGIVLGYSDLLLEEAGATEGLRRNVAEIKAATQRAASLTRQLLALSRQQVLEPKVLDVNAVVWETHKLLRRLIPENIDLVPMLEPNLQPVKVDPAQIQQILINLVVNARDAMPEGGKVVIETANVELDEEYAGRHIEVQPGDYVMLAVSDNGSGIDEPTQARIFEPFFTTKQEGKGTGLGLSTVYGIVRQSGGHITVESALGEGTRFRIYLPPTATAELEVKAQEDETTPMQTEILSGTETVLVVEDQPALLRLISVCLGKRGYTVLAAEDGAEALRILENNPGEIDLVVSDIMMPKVNGLELMKKATLLRPEMRFLFISGYAEDTIGRTAHLPPDAGYLEKPFLPIELARKVRELLNESDAGRRGAGKTA
jgi:PAS domain S-box-containing protein